MTKCSHCQLPYKREDLKAVPDGDGGELYFCCGGCESVYFLLQGAELGSFYDKISTTLSPIKQAKSSSLNRFDTTAFEDKFISIDKQGYAHISLIISGIHCAACIWLNEQILLKQKGIISVSINYTNNKASIVWDKQALPLSSIITLIQSIGYDAYPYDSRSQEHADKKQMKEYYTRVIVAVFCTMNIMWIAVAQYSGYFLGIEREAKDILNLASFILCTPTLFYSGFIFYRSSYYGLKNGFIGMDLLVAVGSSLTYFYSIYAGISHSGETYFESVSMIITFVLIGKFLEVRARKNAGDSLDKLSNLLPLSVEVCIDDNPSNTKTISPEEVKVGDLLLVRAGDKIAIDGILVSEFALCDMQAINGESIPRELHKGDEILSGSINLNHHILYKASKVFSQSIMSHIIELVSSSLDKRPQIQNTANAISQYFSRVVLCIALLCFLGWYFIAGVGTEKALMIAISVIIIACPCALALATPIAAVVGIGESYKHNVLFKQAQFLESLSKAKMVVFDKTGTLTNGTPQVQRAHLDSIFDKSVILHFTQMSNHPVAKGVSHYLKTQGVATSSNIEIKNFTQHDGQGISAELVKNGDCAMLFGGNLNYLAKMGFVIPNITLGAGLVFGFGIESQNDTKKKIIQIFELQDSAKTNAPELIAMLHKKGIDTALLSGDRVESVKEIANLVGIHRFYAELNPLQKTQWIESYKQDSQNIVVMVGDGINDAPALSKSDIAISMGAGSDIAIMSSDVVILDDKLDTLMNAFKIAHRTYNGIKQNIALSIGYNALSIPLAVAGLVIPLFAALSMSLSSIIVVLNSLRIKRKM